MPPAHKAFTLMVMAAAAPCALAMAPAPFNASFGVNLDWSSGVPLPTYNFSVRQLNALVWPRDGRTYAYADMRL